jgi:hypothetical protein
MTDSDNTHTSTRAWVRARRTGGTQAVNTHQSMRRTPSPISLIWANWQAQWMRFSRGKVTSQIQDALAGIDSGLRRVP